MVHEISIRRTRNIAVAVAPIKCTLKMPKNPPFVLFISITGKSDILSKEGEKEKKTSVWCVACVTLIALLEKKFVTFSFIGVAQCSVFSVCLPQCLAAGIQKSSRANTIEAVKWAAIKQLSNTRTINDVLCQWTYQSHTLPKLITFSINVAEFDAR